MTNAIQLREVFAVNGILSHECIVLKVMERAVMNVK